MATITDLLEKLKDEKFGGETIDWEVGSWGQGRAIKVHVAQDQDNFYYKQGKKVFVQSKNGPPKDRVPVCYGCETPAKVLHATAPVYETKMGPMFSGSGRVESVYSLYCTTCEPENIGAATLLEIGL